MSKAIITESKLTAIANAIRSKTGESGAMTPDEMATAISGIQTGGLPAEYQQVEYIESTGTQYIDTGLTSADYDEFAIVGNFTSLATTQCMLAYTPNSSNRYASQWFGAFDSKFYFGFIGDNYWRGNKTADTNEHGFNSSFKNQLWWVDSTKTSQSSSTATRNSTATQYLFARHDVDNGVDVPALYCTFRLKRAVFYDDNQMPIRYFIPCVRNADNVAGLYDMVNGVFYTNQGTGTFLKGGDV